MDEDENLKTEEKEESLNHNIFIESLIDLTPDIIYIYDLIERKNIYVNSGIEKVLGYSAREIKNLGSEVISTLMHPDDLKIYLEETCSNYSMLADSMILSHSYRMKHKNGEWRWLEAREAIYKRKEDGRPKQILGIIRDISKRKEVELELKHKNELLEISQDLMKVGSWEYDLINEKMFWTKEMYSIHDITPKEVGPDAENYIKLSQKCYPLKSRKIIMEAFSLCVEKGDSYGLTLPFISIKGRPLWVRTSGRAEWDNYHNKIIRVIGTLADITEKENERIALEENRRSLSTLLSNLNGMVYRCMNDKEWTMKFVSRGVLDLTGYNDEELLENRKLSFADLIHPDDRDMVWNTVQVALSKKEPYKIEYRILDKNGVERWVWEQGVGIFSNDKLLFLEGFITDITAFKEANRNIKLLSSLVEQSLDGMAVADIDGNLNFSNKAWNDIHGYSSSEVLGKNLKMFHTEKQFKEEVVPFNEEVRKHGNFRGEVGHVTKDGKEMVLLMTSFLLKNEHDIPYALATVSKDITERKKLQKEIEEKGSIFRELFNNMQEGVAIYEIDGENILIKDFNKSAERIEEIKKEDIVGKKIDEVFPGVKEMGLTSIILQVWNDGKERNFPMGFYRDEYRKGWRENFVYKLPSGEIVVIYSDVTKKKENEEQLIRYQEHLEDIIKERTRELNEQKINAEIANRAKADFLSNVSHEMRTPLTAILGFSQMIYDQLLGPINDKQKESLLDVLNSGKHLLAIVEDILDISAIESGKIKIFISEFSLHELVKNAEFVVREKVVDKKIKLSMMCSTNIGMIKTDKRKVKQILFNLLSNSVKFTQEGGQIDISVRKSVDAVDVIPEDIKQKVNLESSIIFSVKDNGVGISDTDKERIFVKFTQLESPLVKTQPGLGLGLSLSRELARVLGGDLWFTSAGKNKGSTFFFILPINN